MYDEISELAEMAACIIDECAANGDARSCLDLRERLESLAVAAAMRAHAIDSRLSGNIAEAMSFEARSEVRLTDAG